MLAPHSTGALIFLILTIVVAVAFDFTNGFHDTANAIATSVSTRVISARLAVFMAAILNFVGAFVTTSVAKTIGSDVANATALTSVVVMSALLAAITWNLVTWYLGLPSSSSHALIGGIIGAAVAGSASHFDVLHLEGILEIVLSLLLSPLAGFVIAYLLIVVLTRLFHNLVPTQVTTASRWLQRLSAAFVAFAHGSNDAQKTMGVITAAVLAYQYGTTPTSFNVPDWVILLCATAMALGTSFGGWRIIRTMGMQIAKLRPLDGFAAESSSALVIMVASVLGLPVSTTHTIAGSIMGVGAHQRLSAVRWGVAGNIVFAWILTGPLTALLAALIYGVFHLFGL